MRNALAAAAACGWLAAIAAACTGALPVPAALAAARGTPAVKDGMASPGEGQAVAAGGQAASRARMAGLIAGGAAASINMSRSDCSGCHVEIFPIFRPDGKALGEGGLLGRHFGGRRCFEGWTRTPVRTPPGTPGIAVYSRDGGFVRRFYALEPAAAGRTRFFLPAAPAPANPHRLLESDAPPLPAAGVRGEGMQ